MVRVETTAFKSVLVNITEQPLFLEQSVAKQANVDLLQRNTCDALMYVAFNIRNIYQKTLKKMVLISARKRR